MSKGCLRWACGLMLMMTTLGVQAHYLNIARFAFFEQEDPRHVRLLVDNLPENIRPDQSVDWPSGCQVLERRESRPGVLPSVVIEADCEAQTQGLIQTRWGLDGGMLEWHYRDGRVDALMQHGSNPGIALSLPDWHAEAPLERGFLATAGSYLLLGTEHVLIGWDHLAFVFCISLLAGGAGLIWLISAFTLGHSLSLALAHFGVVNIPIGPVEAIIALSVVFMAREAWLVRRQHWFPQPSATGQPSTYRKQLGLTAGFGLIHGLGFASVLGGLGVTAGDTVTGLLFFNIGVELGQILFVMAVLMCLVAAARIHLDRAVIRTAVSLVGAMGMVWTLQRVLG